MSTDPREIGTLIAVLLKARNLPNKRHIGKQDPYCVVEFNGRKYNTKVIKRGGQHPEWDEEIRFTLYELDADDTTPEPTPGRAPPPPPKKAKGVPNVQGGTFMKISCYAQDVKEPDFIGETHVDLTEVLTKGETDEWFTLTNKDRYCGEVYLELTFWSNEPAPMKKAPVKAKARKQYGGPGTFTAHPDARGSSESLGGSPSRWSPSGVSAMKTGGSSNTWRHSFTDVDIRPEALPRSLRSSSSIAQIGLYRPNYENTGTHSSAHSSHSTQQSASSVSSLTDELGQMNLRRRLSLPQITHTELVRGTTSSASTNWSQPSSVGYSHASYSSHSDNRSTYNYDGPDTQSGSVSLAQHRTGGPSLYQPPYEPVSRASSVYSTHPQSQPSRGPRHSLPSSSSGFVPISTSASAAFPAPTPAPQMHMYQTPPVSASPGAPIYRHTSVPPSNITQAIPTTMYAPPSGPPPGVQPFRPPTTAPSAASYPPAVSQTPAPPSPFSSISQQLAGSANPLPQTMSYQSLPQSQSLYSYHSYPTSSSISSNQYSQSPTPPSAASVGSNVSYHSVFQQNPPSFQQQQNQSRPPPPPSPASVPPPPAVRHNQSQPHSLPQVPPPPPLGQMQVYGRSAPTDRAPSQMSAAPSHISVNVPPPPPLNPSPSQSHMSRPLPEVPQGGTSPMKRSGTMSMALSHAVGGGSLSVQPSVAYPSYNQIPPPPPLTTPSNMTSGHHSPPISVPPPPPLPEDRRLTQPSAPQSQPQPQTVPALPSHHQPPKRTQSAQALYHNAMARQQAAIGATPLPPPPPIGQQQQSAYHALQQRTVPQSYAPPPMNDRPGVGPGMTTYPGPPRAPSVHPGALGSLPMPPRLAPSQSVHQQYNAVNASGWQ